MKEARLIHSIKADGYKISLYITEHAFLVVIFNSKGGRQQFRFDNFPKAYKFFCNACELLSSDDGKSNLFEV